MPGLRDTLEAATPGGKPPYRIAGIPAGIISADDYDVTDDALAFLALAPELAAWSLDVFERHAHLLDDDLLNRWQKITGGE